MCWQCDLSSSLTHYCYYLHFKIFLAFCACINRTAEGLDGKGGREGREEDDIEQMGWNQTWVTVARTQPLYMGCLLSQRSY